MRSLPPPEPLEVLAIAHGDSVAGATVILLWILETCRVEEIEIPLAHEMHRPLHERCHLMFTSISKERFVAMHPVVPWRTWKENVPPQRACMTGWESQPLSAICTRIRS